MMTSRSSCLAPIAGIFASDVAGEATAQLHRVIDVGRSTDAVKRLIATDWCPRQVPGPCLQPIRSSVGEN